MKEARVRIFSRRTPAKVGSNLIDRRVDSHRRLNGKGEEVIVACSAGVL